MEVEGDLLTFPADVIVHQCNCVTRRGQGLSHELFERYPFADIYSGRRTPSTPGTLVMSREQRPYIVSLLAQYYPGPARWDPDLPLQRLQWFRECLTRLEGEPECQNSTLTLAFPHKIGCGLAQGDWREYRKLIESFAARVPARVVIVRKSV